MKPSDIINKVRESWQARFSRRKGAPAASAVLSQSDGQPGQNDGPLSALKAALGPNHKSKITSLRKGPAELDAEAQSQAQALSLSRYLAWVFLALILGLSIFLSFIIGNSARQVMLQKQYEFANLLSDNLNHQIYRRFTLPTLVGFGRIALRQPAQYERLDQLVRQAIHGMNVQDLRIYDYNNVVTYTINIDDLGRPDLVTPQVQQAMDSPEPIFTLDSNLSTLQGIFSFDIEPGTFILRTTSALRIENRLNSSAPEEGPVMGVLSFTQDVTQDMITVIQFQRSLIGLILVSCLLIFFIMVFFLNRAEKALAARVEEKERLRQLLHQHEKLAGMGRVIAGIAHEIRNPLGIISSSAQFLIGRSQATDQTSAGILQAIYDESRRLSQTVTDFLDYARPRSPRQSPVDLAAVLNEALVFLGPEITSKNVEVKVNLLQDNGSPAPEGSLMVMGDKDLLYRAFYNVLINGLQALDGQLMRRLSIVGRRLNAESLVEVVISDSGPGFDSEDLSRFLDPFYTTKPLGSGLGLPIVSSIITSHGGVLELMSAAPKGAAVKISLPLAR